MPTPAEACRHVNFHSCVLIYKTSLHVEAKSYYKKFYLVYGYSPAVAWSPLVMMVELHYSLSLP